MTGKVLKYLGSENGMCMRPARREPTAQTCKSSWVRMGLYWPKFKVGASAVALAGVLALSACDHATYYAGVSVAPPPPLASGPVGLAPAPGWVWTDGYYYWIGSSWLWRQGHWARPPHPGYVWRRPYYERYRNGYRMHQGRWVRH